MSTALERYEENRRQADIAIAQSQAARAARQGVTSTPTSSVPINPATGGYYSDANQGSSSRSNTYGNMTSTGWKPNENVPQQSVPINPATGGYYSDANQGNTYGSFGANGWQSNSNSGGSSSRSSSRSSGSSNSSQQSYFGQNNQQSIAPEATEQQSYFNPAASSPTYQPQAQSQKKTFQEKNIWEKYLDITGLDQPIGEQIKTWFGLNNQNPLEGADPEAPYGYFTNEDGTKTPVTQGESGMAAQITAEDVHEAYTSFMVVKSLANTVKKLFVKGAALEAGQATLEIGKAAEGAKVIKTTAEATKVTKVFADAAKVVSPKNWKTILGWGATAVAVASAAYFSFSGTANAQQDDFQQLSIGVSKLKALGDDDGADKLVELMEEMKEFTESIKSKIPFYNYFTAVGIEVDHMIQKTKLEIAATDKKAVDQIAVNEFQKRYAAGQTTVEEQDAWIAAHPDEFLVGQILNARNNERLYGGSDTEDAPEGELEGEPEAEKDPLSPFPEYNPDDGTSTPSEAEFAKRREEAEYNQILYGKDYTGERTVNEAPSTLGFGLLKTGGETKTEPIDPADMPGIEVLDTVAMRLFGVPFNELSPALQAIVNQNA